MGAGKVDEARQRQAEDGIVGLAGHRRGDDRDPVIAAHPGQDLAALRMALGGVHEPQHLDQRVVRLGSRIGVENAAVVEGRDLDQLFREHHRLVRHPSEEGVIAGKAVVLRLGGLGHLRVVESRDHVPEAGIGVEVAVAVNVDNVGPLAVGEHDGAAVADCGQVGEAVEGVGLGPGLPAVGLVAHDASGVGFARTLAPRGGGFNGGRAGESRRTEARVGVVGDEHAFAGAEHLAGLERDASRAARRAGGRGGVLDRGNSGGVGGGEECVQVAGGARM